MKIAVINQIGNGFRSERINSNGAVVSTSRKLSAKNAVLKDLRNDINDVLAAVHEAYPEIFAENKLPVLTASEIDPFVLDLTKI